MNTTIYLPDLMYSTSKQRILVQAHTLFLGNPLDTNFVINITGLLSKIAEIQILHGLDNVPQIQTYHL